MQAYFWSPYLSNITRSACIECYQLFNYKLIKVYWRLPGAGWWQVFCWSRWRHARCCCSRRILQQIPGTSFGSFQHIGKYNVQWNPLSDHVITSFILNAITIQMSWILKISKQEPSVRRKIDVAGGTLISVKKEVPRSSCKRTILRNWVESFGSSGSKVRAFSVACQGRTSKGWCTFRSDPCRRRQHRDIYEWKIIINWVTFFMENNNCSVQNCFQKLEYLFICNLLLALIFSLTTTRKDVLGRKTTSTFCLK